MRSAVVATAQAPSWRSARTRPATIVSVAMAVPDNVVTNATVAEGAGVTEQWIVHRTGVHERRHVTDGERLQDLASAAGRQALDEAGLAAEDVDLVLVATVGADELLPNAAPLVALDLGATRPARWTWARPARASCRRCRSRPRRWSPGAASTCS